MRAEKYSQNKYSLNFNEKDLEKEYEEIHIIKRASSPRKQAICYIITGGILIIILLISSAGDTNHFFLPTYLMSSSITLYILLLLKPAKKSIWLFGFKACLFVCFIEYVINFIKVQERPELCENHKFFIFGGAFFIFTKIISSVEGTHWRYELVLWFICSFYSTFRLFINNQPLGQVCLFFLEIFLINC